MSETIPLPAAADPPARPADKVSVQDWLAVIAGMIGSLMALMDVSIVNSSLPVIQGEIGATPSEGTWVNTAYLIAEIVVIPLTAWFERLLGLRRLLLLGASLFTAFSVVCGFATSLETMIFGRIGQGFTGGVLIPTALTIVATRLPPRIQPIGLAITAMAALLGPVIGPLVGGWLTEHYSWHLAFLINVPICGLLVALLLIAFPPSRGNLAELRNADWYGIAGMILGLGAMTTLLEEGHREQWFESSLIWSLAGVTLTGFALIAIGQLRPGRPVIRLALLRNAGLASATLLLGGLGMVLYSGMFLIPQFLVAIAGYTALQAGLIAVIGAAVSIPIAFIYPATFVRLDPRLTVLFAMLSVAAANWLASGLTVASVGGDLALAQLLFGMGTTLSAIPLQQAVISSVPAEDAAEANALSAISRNLGGSIALSVIASFQEQRFDVHRWQLHGSLGANDPELQRKMAEAAATFGGGPEGWEMAWRSLDGQVMQQALVMTFNDLFLALAMAAVTVTPFVLLLRKPPPGAGMAMGH